MNNRSMLLPLALGLGLTVALMWLLSPSGGGLPVARATSYTVCPAGPPTCDYSVIQNAVDVARNGDVIKVAAGTYNDVNNYYGLKQVVYIAKSVTIRGGYTTAFTEPPDPEANPTTLDAGGRGRVIYIEGPVSPTIEGLRITGGDATVLGSNQAGGGIRVVDAKGTIRNDYIFSNTAENGGGLEMVNSTTTLIGNTIISNTADTTGGGIDLRGSAATLIGNTISDNTAHYPGGGGVNLYASPATLIGNTISGNAGDHGGGLHLTFSPATLISNTISGNDSGGGLYLNESAATLTGNNVISNTGGGVNVNRSAATLTGNTIISNTGGGVDLTDGGNVLISGNTISYNSADYGGGMSVGGGTVTISGNTISFNNATAAGGGVLLWGHSNGDSTLTGNNIANNTAAGDVGGGLFLYHGDGDFIARLIGNTIVNNTAREGGGLALDDEAELINNLIVDNQATGCCGSGVRTAESGSLRLVHNTIARNTGGGGIGVSVHGTRTVSMTNTILVGHLVGIRVDPGNTATLESTLWGNELDWEVGGTLIRSNDYWGNPDFVDPDNGDYHLGENSAALDAGVDAGVTTDIDFHPRPYLNPDLGADEYWPPGTLTFIYMPVVMR